MKKMTMTALITIALSTVFFGGCGEKHPEEKPPEWGYEIKGDSLTVTCTDNRMTAMKVGGLVVYGQVPIKQTLNIDDLWYEGRVNWEDTKVRVRFNLGGKGWYYLGGAVEMPLPGYRPNTLGVEIQTRGGTEWEVLLKHPFWEGDGYHLKGNTVDYYIDGVNTDDYPYGKVIDERSLNTNGVKQNVIRVIKTRGERRYGWLSSGQHEFKVVIKNHLGESDSASVNFTVVDKPAVFTDIHLVGERAHLLHASVTDTTYPHITRVDLYFTSGKKIITLRPGENDNLSIESEKGRDEVVVKNFNQLFPFAGPFGVYMVVYDHNGNRTRSRNVYWNFPPKEETEK